MIDAWGEKRERHGLASYRNDQKRYSRPSRVFRAITISNDQVPASLRTFFPPICSWPCLGRPLINGNNFCVLSNRLFEAKEEDVDSTLWKGGVRGAGHQRPEAPCRAKARQCQSFSMRLIKRLTCLKGRLMINTYYVQDFK